MTAAPRSQQSRTGSDAVDGPTESAVFETGTWPATRRLRMALRANAAFSLVTGTGLVTVGWALASW